MEVFDITNPRFNEQIVSPVPWHFVKSRFHCTLILPHKSNISHQPGFQYYHEPFALLSAPVFRSWWSTAATPSNQKPGAQLTHFSYNLTVICIHSCTNRDWDHCVATTSAFLLFTFFTPWKYWKKPRSLNGLFEKQCLSSDLRQIR